MATRTQNAVPAAKQTPHGMDLVSVAIAEYTMWQDLFEWATDPDQIDRAIAGMRRANDYLRLARQDLGVPHDA